MCYYSQLIKNPKYTPNKKNGGVVPYMADKRVAVVPIGCRQCKECRKAKQREWQVRLKEDIKHNTNGKFITLTFSNEWIAKITREVTRKTKKKNVSIWRLSIMGKIGVSIRPKAVQLSEKVSPGKTSST